MQDKATLRSDPSGIQGYTFCRGQASDVPITTGWNLILQKKKDEFDLRLKCVFFSVELDLRLSYHAPATGSIYLVL